MVKETADFFAKWPVRHYKIKDSDIVVIPSVRDPGSYQAAYQPYYWVEDVTKISSGYTVVSVSVRYMPGGRPRVEEVMEKVQSRNIRNK